MIPPNTTMITLYIMGAAVCHLAQVIEFVSASRRHFLDISPSAGEADIDPGQGVCIDRFTHSLNLERISQPQDPLTQTSSLALII